MKEVLSFLFMGKLPPHIRIKTMKTPSGKSDIQHAEVRSIDFKMSLIRMFSWALVFVLAVSILGVFVLATLGRDVPDFVPPIITAILGYFGGAVTSYFGLKSS